ncbi:MAG: CpaF family protein [Firmicutes bacterium]|nr:CpaF family protein [Bacillota bacterium]
MENKVNNRIKSNNEYVLLKRELIKIARKEIMQKGNEIDDESAFSEIEKIVFESKDTSMLPISELRKLVMEVFLSIRSEYDILTPYINDESVTEIMVNGFDNIFIERNGSIEKLDVVFDSVETLEEVIRRIAARVHREVNERSPILDARLSNGARVNAVYKNVALDGPVLSIRKFPKTAFDMKSLVNNGTISEEGAEFLEMLVRAGYNIFVSGGTSSGKTTFLNVLSEYIPEDERVIVIEDSAELQLRGIENLVRMECRNANIQGVGEVSMDMLIRNSLRMRPDWIVVGEIRGRECISMLQAMNTGHYSMSTGHANSIEGMLGRMEAMCLQSGDVPSDSVRHQIARGIDLIVHLGRINGVGRKVLEIAEIQGFENNNYIINTIFKFKMNEGLVATGNSLMNVAKLELAGYVNDRD